MKKLLLIPLLIVGSGFSQEEKKSFLEIYKKDQHHKFFSSTDKSVYAQQISNVSNLIGNKALEGKFPNINLKESIEIMKLITEWKEKIKL